MITGFLINVALSVIGFFVGLLPVIAMPAGFVDAITLFWGYLNSFSAFFPMSTLVTVLGFAVTFHFALFGYDLSLKVYHMIRGR